MTIKLIIGCLQSIIDIYEMSKNEKPWANVPIDSEDVEAIRLSIEKWGEQNAEPCEDGMWSLKYAADALKRHGLLQEQEPCEDAISRQAVMDAMYELCGEGSLKDNPWRDNPHIDSIIYTIEDLPSVTPKQETVTEFADRCRECGSMIGRNMKQKMGRWIREKKHHKDDFQEFDYWDVRCSECGARKRIGWTNIRHCPMCGAKMEESE